MGTRAIAIAMCMAVSWRAAADDRVGKAKAAVEASDYIAAKGLVADAIAAGDNNPEQLAELYRLSGVVAGALGDAKAATAAFERCLALAPATELPRGTSPKIARPFAAAQKTATGREALAGKAETAPSPPGVTVVVASDPLKMVARVRVLVVVDGAPPQTIERPASERTAIDLPHGRRLDVRVVALDDKNNHVAEVGTAELPLVIVGEAPVVEKPVTPPVVVAKKAKPPGKPRGFALQWYVWGTGAVLAGAATAYFGIEALGAKRDLDDLNATSPNHTFDEAQAVELRARHRVLFTNIGFAATGTLAAGAAILYLTAPRHPRERAARVTPVPVQGGAAVVLGGSF